MAVHVCGARFQCHTCNSIYLGYGGGPIWPYAFVVPDFGATHVTPSMWAIGGGGAYLAIHVCGAGFWCHTCGSFYCGLQGGPKIGRAHV